MTDNADKIEITSKPPIKVPSQHTKKVPRPDEKGNLVEKTAVTEERIKELREKIKQELKIPEGEKLSPAAKEARKGGITPVLPHYDKALRHAAANIVRDKLKTAEISKLSKEKEETEAKAEMLEKIAMYDPRTGIRSEAWAIDELDRKIAEAKRTGRSLYVIQFDLDDFKNYNTRYGHPGGDRILNAIAFLRTRAEEPLARYGGDEFLHIVDEDLKDEDIPMIIARHRATIKKVSKPILEDMEKNPEHPDEGNPVAFTTLTFGIAKYSGNETAKELIGIANNAMLVAKRLGKDRACIAEKIGDKIVNRELPNLEYTEG